MKGGLVTVVGVLALVVGMNLVGSVAGAPAQPQKGGILKIAQKAEPETLDIMWSTGDLIYWIAANIYENLLSLDEERNAVPHLAQAHTQSGDGLTHTFRLRRGVKFHNGKEMTSEDVVASLKRWLEISALGRGVIGPRTVDVVATDRYLVEWRLRQPTSVLPYALARWTQGAAIYPAEVARAAGRRMITDYVGTGPYRFVEWKSGTLVKLARYDGYQPVERPANGPAGRRVAFLDELHFLFVPESSVASIGVEAGDFHFVIEAEREQYTRYRFSRRVQSFNGKRGMAWLAPNHQGPVLRDPRMRHAVLAATCVDPILQVYTHTRFYQKVPAVMGAGPFATDVGRELYNQCNPQRARQLLQEARYDGRPIKVLLTAGDQPKIDMTLVLQQQLAPLGVELELLVRDSAAYGRIRLDRNQYDATFNESSMVEHPTLLSHIPQSGISGWTSAEKDRLVSELLAATNHQQGMDIWRRLERLWYQDVVTVKFGNFFGYSIARQELQGYTDRPHPFFWNVWLQKR